MMHSVKVIQRCRTPRGELQLQQRGEEFEIISNGCFLMSTVNGESEQLLVRLAIQDSAAPRRILIGGLGVGYSLGEALRFQEVEQVTVVEIEEQVIQWNRHYLRSYSGDGLDHPRTRVVHGDIKNWLEKSREKFDVVCMDTDNGPDWTVFEGNKALYGEWGLRLIHNRLSENGVASFWSASASSKFSNRLKSVFASVKEIPVPVEKGEPDYIYLCHRR
ncbi:spermine/spermidine synthase [Kroppenstedtia pulmonis]|uniref:Spermine/spermidine synthase n=2 Tax=Kroppenstedtia pulmonis TaxID=1380685 RepID=A0A7D3Y435_9BACL|nr:spermine/spermidine synthase [Kroppenstedtia pulmonis]QKG83905.1 spermine/spermidine synthase [Kroppenstedtia pulmonis]